MRLCFRHRVEAPIAAVFAFHSDPRNLALLLARWPGFRISSHDGSTLPGSRTWVEQRVLAGRVALRMGFEHDVWEPPYRFSEHMIQGPYARFVHEHIFEEAGGATIVRDELDLRLAPWRGGELALRLYVAPWMRRCFRCRHAALDELVREGKLQGAGA